MHCTVQPGKYCMLVPPQATAANDSQNRAGLKPQNGGLWARATCGVKKKEHKI